MSSFTISPNGTVDRGTWTTLAGGTTNLHLGIDDYVAGGSQNSDTDGIEGPNLGDSTAFFDLEATPADFDPANITSIQITSAYRKNEGGVSGAADTTALFYQLFRSDGSTPITTELSLGNITSTAYAETTDALTGTGTHTKTDWDGARLAIRQDYTQVGCADATARLRVSAVGVVVTYTVPVNVQPDLGVLDLTGLAPAASVGSNVTALPDVGPADLTGLAPAVSVSSHVTVAPGVGQFDATGLAPTVQTPKLVAADLGQLALAGLAPDASGGSGSPTTVAPGVGSLDATGLAPTILTPVTVAPDLGALAAAGLAPTVETPRTVATGLGTGTYTGEAPSLTSETTVSTDTGDGDWTGYEPSILTPVLVGAGVGSLDLTGYSPSAESSSGLTTGLGVLTYTGFAPFARRIPEIVRPPYRVSLMPSATAVDILNAYVTCDILP